MYELDRERFIFLRMADAGPFRKGTWWSWGYIGDEKERVFGGGSVEFQLKSPYPPGFLNCKLTGGDIATIGVGEHLPPELEDEIPISQDLARGYTIGPDERLTRFNEQAKIDYLVENLPKMLEEGWMSEGTMKNYKRVLGKKDLKLILKKARKDIKEKFIAPEVLYVIEGLANTK